jgi:hypothetical protein
MGSLLNYLGGTPQPGQSMPGAAPGSGSPFDPTMSAASAGAQQGPPPLAPGMAFAGVPSSAAPPPPPAPPGPGGTPSAPLLTDPSGRAYIVEPQQDHSLLLRLVNPDGSPGQAVKIIPPPIKPPAQPQPQPAAAAPGAPPA